MSEPMELLVHVCDEVLTLEVLRTSNSTRHKREAVA